MCSVLQTLPQGLTFFPLTKKTKGCLSSNSPSQSLLVAVGAIFSRSALKFKTSEVFATYSLSSFKHRLEYVFSDKLFFPPLSCLAQMSSDSGGISSNIHSCLLVIFLLPRVFNFVVIPHRGAAHTQFGAWSTAVESCRETGFPRLEGPLLILLRIICWRCFFSLYCGGGPPRDEADYRS